jgi:RING finger protein 170
MSYSDFVSGSFIEGFGDDLVQAASLAIFTIIVILGYFYFWKTDTTTIHAESESLVGDVRQQLRAEDSNLLRTMSRGQIRHDITCPVCLSEVQYPIETNCGHIYCANCMITYWNTGRWNGAVRCPSCRQTVTILLVCFSEDELRSTSEEKQRLVANINLYNRRFSGQPLTWMEYFLDLPTILRHCMTDFFSIGGLIWMFRLRIVVCFLIALLYLLSPLDIIPEAAFGLFGLLDDMFVMFLLAIYISILYRRFIAHRATNETGPIE